jgi:DNA polymerase III sliding clamp (beta) subunit (PCNA family)
MKEDEVEVTTADGELLIEGKKRKAGIRMDVEIALPLDAVEQPGKWSKLSEGFWDVLTIAAQCASRDESQFILTCVHLTPTCVESCDRFQIVRCPIETVLDGVLLRASSIKSLTGMDLVGVSGTESWVHFRNKAGLVLSCRKYEGQYPDLDDFVKVKGQRTKLPKEIGEAVSRAEVFSSAEKDDNVLQVELRQGKMRLTGRGPNGWYSETSPINYEGEQTRFTIAPKMLLEICKKADECTIGDGRIKVETDKFTYVSCVGKVEEKG